MFGQIVSIMLEFDVHSQVQCALLGYAANIFFLIFFFSSPPLHLLVHLIAWTAPMLLISSRKKT